MGYTTDLSILKTAYGYDDNIRVGCPALWMLNYYDSSDPLDALVLGTLDPNKLSFGITPFSRDVSYFRGYCYPRGLMWPVVGSVGGIPAVGHSSTYNFSGFKNNIDSYFQKECAANTESIKTANVIDIYIKKDSETSYTAVFRINIPKASSTWIAASKLESYVIAYTVYMKVPRSIYNPASYPALQLTFPKSNLSLVSLDATYGYILASKTATSGDLSFATYKDIYERLTLCANQGLPVGMFAIACY